MNSYLSDNQLKKKIIIINSLLPIKLLKVIIPAGCASITPPLGPLLGQYGININEFCKEFNEESNIFEKETLIPLKIYFASNKNFYIEFLTLSVSYLIKKLIESNEKEDLVFFKDEFLIIAYQIAFYKLNIYNFSFINIELSNLFFKNYINCIIGTMRSFGLQCK
jgi:large subunit ribosomal protein L11